jgi:hypothetical protein
MMNIWNGSWDFSENMLNGFGHLDQWDDILLQDVIFNEYEYTIIFDAFLRSGYEPEQFHFILNYNTGYSVMEIGSSPSSSHYIDSAGNWSNLDLAFPLDRWAKVHMSVSGGKIDLWVDGDVITSDSVMMSPYLEQIGFGLFSHSSAQFDNIQIFNTAFPPEIPPTTDQVFYDEYWDYDLWNRYHAEYGVGVEWIVEEDRLCGVLSSTAVAGFEWLVTGGLEFIPDLQTATIDVDFDIHHTSPNDEIYLLSWRFNSGGNVLYVSYSAERKEIMIGSFDPTGYHEIKNSYYLDEQLTWGHLTVAIGVKEGTQTTDVFLTHMDNGPWIVLSYEETSIFGCGNVGVGMKRDGDPQMDTRVYWDNLMVRKGYYAPNIGPGPGGPKPEEYGVKEGDTFTYQITRLGPGTQINLAGWFSNKMTSETSLLASQGDVIKLVVTGFLDYGIEIEVYQNNLFVINGTSNFFFLPINTDLSNFGMFEGGTVVQEGDQYLYVMTFYDDTTNNATVGSITGEVEFRWDVTTGVLETVEVTSGLVPSEGELFDDFYFELTSSDTDGGTNTIPNLTSGWDIVTVLGILLILPIYLRKKKRN